MFQNVLMAVTPLSETKEINSWENRPFVHSWPESSRQKKINKDTGTRTIKKKSKRNRTAYTTDQLKSLEKAFEVRKYIDADRRKELAKYLNIGEKCVKVWFQNRRMKEKRDILESNPDSSSEYIYKTAATSPSVVQNTCEDQYIPNNYIHPIPTKTDPQLYYYPIEQDMKNLQSSHGIGYQNYNPVEYINYSVPSHPNDYYQSHTNINPTQYPYATIPDYMYTNTNNTQFIQDQMNTFSEVPNWSNNTELTYF
ncbi:homeobox protein pnx-like [Bicyclus anynana]|uniref:Homeobox protein pnx-like n=1 Tax=Bicyclus anynana TaxID=110368 RepID=A0A6J1P8R2_BICAN|nr:homeobox protein pnx-like [Bicyclus anynana]